MFFINDSTPLSSSGFSDIFNDFKSVKYDKCFDIGSIFDELNLHYIIILITR